MNTHNIKALTNGKYFDFSTCRYINAVTAYRRGFRTAATRKAWADSQRRHNVNYQARKRAAKIAEAKAMVID